MTPSTLPATVRTVDPSRDPAWESLAARLGGDVFHAPAWMRALAHGYGLEPRALVLQDAAGALLGGLVTATVRDALGEREVALPFSDCADPLLADDADWAPLADRWLQGDRPARLRCRRARAPLADPRLETTGWAQWHATSLDRDLDAIEASFDSSARRAMARAARAGVTVRPATGLDDLRAFFLLHLRLRKHKYRLLAQPYRFFVGLWNEFLAPGHGELLLAEHQGIPIAGVLLLDAFGRTYYKLNASDPAHLERRPNDLLVWHGIQRAHARGASRFDFGISDSDQPGLARYKQKFADLSGRVTFLARRDAAERTPAEVGLIRAFSELTALLTRQDVPDEVTEAAGDELYRFFA